MIRLRSLPLALLIAAAVAATAWWHAAAPADAVIADQYPLADPAPELRAVTAAGDELRQHASIIAPHLPGQDEVVLQEDRGRAFVTALDGQIWRLDLASGAARPWVRAPLIPAGARFDPRNPDLLYFCASRLHGRASAPDERPGLYRLHIESRRIEPVLLDVPAGALGHEAVPAASAALALDAMTPANSRPVQFCNDLDISADGQRIVFSEPFAAADASMGGGAFNEAITRARNGRLWLVDLQRRSVRLAASGFAFIDGVLWDAPSAGGGEETSLLITETTNFRLLRLHLGDAGPGRFEVLHANLPGLPDGLDRDPQGRIWIGLIKLRTPLATTLHNHAWLKSLLLRLPRSWLPVGRSSGVMALSPDGRTPLYASLHDGSVVPDISVVVPGRDRLYLPRFRPDVGGLAVLPYPAALDAKRSAMTAVPAP
ncbi:SMP-30/gluconolactonase/LRE family protein [Aquincola sp. S2]|uniref:SMP-30/gluconolactonase/LRE family protein n=1 Tax=Pseudaquabacterium terrae TaxID=2732868 RepID=A0ABX2EE75_9BURK|nr:SMP-30/gluconolactonase/LRE family protein [Aquabacterium terrae]NRF66913.1 SMP-30/gluconolactonase/LRE family protein [Aquabacterium terrae]